MSSIIVSSTTDAIGVGLARHHVIGAWFLLPDGSRFYYEPQPDPHASMVPIVSTCFRGGKDG